MLVDLGNKVRLVWRLFSIETKCESSAFGELMIVVGIVDRAAWGFGEIMGEVALVSVADRGFPVRELASIGVESYRTFRVVILETLRFGEPEANLGGRVIRQMFLHFLVTHHRDFTHVINFIKNHDK